MRQEQIYITLEIPMGENDMQQSRNPGFWREGMEYMRTLADKKAEAVGGRVVTDRPPEMGTPRFADRASGLFVGETTHWLLWWSKWWVEVPNGSILRD